MFKNIFKIAVRSILKDKSYSLINLLGLTIGITCSLFLLLYIKDELSYDRYHKNADNIYRIISHFKEPDKTFTWAKTQVPLAEELRNNYPEVENAVRFLNIGRQLYKKEDKEFYEESFYLTDSTVFDMFSYEFVKGDPRTALDMPFSIVLTEELAKKYFGQSDPIGHSIQNEQNEELIITGVIKNVPNNSHFRFGALISRNTMPQYMSKGGWKGFGIFTYIQLPAGYDVSKMYVNLDTILNRYVDPFYDPLGMKITYDLQRITDIHLHSKIQDEAEAGGDISYIYIFGAVAVFMLVIASINYMNLATARSVNRAREVGIRKVMGSQRFQLMAQFMAESVVMTMAALVISLILVYSLLPFFNNIANKQLPFSYISQPNIVVGLLGVVLFTGVVGGSYPAFYLSSFTPIGVLNGKFAAKAGSALFRKVLVVLQFGISIFMLISTLILYDQLQYIRNKDLGFDKEEIIRLNMGGKALQQPAPALAEKLKEIPLVAGVGFAGNSPGDNIAKIMFQVEDNEGKLVDRAVDLFTANYDFVKTMGMEIVQGRDFSREVGSDTAYAVLVNEAMVKRMAWDNPLGKKFDTYLGPKQVVGVIKDYHQNSLYDVIEPLIIICSEKALRSFFAFVRTEPGDVRQSLALIEKSWKEIYPNNPFEYTFLDQDFNSQYKADEKRSVIFTTFSGLTIVIACLGLLGLAAFTTEQRTKEIGIRKIMGASVNNLVALVSKEFLLLVGIGTLLALPVAWNITNNWLQKFAYRIELQGEWPTFALSALIAFLITLITVGYYVFRTAMQNPVKSLRDE